MEGVIENITKFGAFIRLQDGITGLMPKAKMKFLKEELDNSDLGKSISVRVIQIEMNQKRISLEPAEMPETATDTKDDWKRYKKQKEKKKDYDPDNPFLDLEL
jgi:predicted RNA-binding protein with RPS1 domain